MDLNIDCVRYVMLYLEDHLQFSDEGVAARKCMDWKQVYTDEELTKKYTFDVIQYTLLKIREAKLIDVPYGEMYFKELPRSNKIVNFKIKDITVEGHNFIDNFQNNKVWDNIKSVGKLGLKTIIEVAGKKAVELAAIAMVTPK